MKEPKEGDLVQIKSAEEARKERIGSEKFFEAHEGSICKIDKIEFLQCMYVYTLYKVKDNKRLVCSRYSFKLLSVLPEELFEM